MADRDTNPDEAALIVTRVVHKGAEDRYRHWADRLHQRVRDVPHHLGTLELEQTGGLYHLVQRFASADALANWQADPDCRRLMVEADRFSTPKEQVVSGTRLSACLPSEADSAKWKRFLMTWAAVLPLVTTLNVALRALPWALPPVVQSAISSCLMVAAMTWLILPAISRRLKPWVMRGGDGEARVQDG